MNRTTTATGRSKAPEPAGFTVLEAGSGLEAVAVLGLRTDISAIFTVVDMPGVLNGIDVATMVARASPNIAIVVTSGRADINRNEPRQTAAFLPKPYSMSAAVAAVENVIWQCGEAACPNGIVCSPEPTRSIRATLAG